MRQSGRRELFACLEWVHARGVAVDAAPLRQLVAFFGDHAEPEDAWDHDLRRLLTEARDKASEA